MKLIGQICITVVVFSIAILIAYHYDLSKSWTVFTGFLASDIKRGLQKLNELDVP